MKPQSSIAKGKRFEKWVAKLLEEMGYRATREVGSGSGNKKGDIFSNFPFLIECKNHKKLRLWKSVKQAMAQAKKGFHNSDRWVLVVKDPNSPEYDPDVYAVLDIIEFIKLVKKNEEPIIKEPDKEMLYYLDVLKTHCNKVKKDPNEWNLKNLKRSIKQIENLIKYNENI